MTEVTGTPQQHEAMLRADQARAIRDNPLWPRLLDLVKAEYVRLWSTSSQGDAAVRERYYMGVQAAEDFQKALAIAITEGDVTKAQLEQKARGRAR